MEYVLDFAALALAANAAVTAWLFGSLFDKPREYFEKRKDTFIGELMTCQMCISYHAAFWTALTLWLPAQLLTSPWDHVPRLFLYAFAATTLIHYMQGVLPLAAEPETNTASSAELKEVDDAAVSGGKAV